MARVSERFRYDSTNNRVGSAREMADAAKETMISGRKLRTISDDPVGALRVLRNKSHLNNMSQFRKTQDFARGFLQKSEDALMSVNDSLIRARELAIQLSNSTWDAEGRKVASEEIKQLAEHVVQLGNSSYGDRFVFGGFQTGQPPFSHDGSYLGDDGVIFVQLDEDSFRALNVSGRDIFTPAPDSKDNRIEPIVSSLKGFYDSLLANDADGIRSAISKLDAASSRVLDGIAALGARRTAVDDVSVRLDRQEETLLADTNNIEGADPIKSALDMRRAENALQTTLTASGKLLTPSLMDFLK